jgi:tRNA-2-methylthio-N6-dimethylallyladenosine synthase
MNEADTELVLGILKNSGYGITKNAEQADVILLNTCSIRENAEQRIYGRLGSFKNLKEKNPGLVVGILGCMAERLRKDLIEEKKIVDLVVGPDEYRRVPEFIDNAFQGEKGIGVILSRTETYDDIEPYSKDGLPGTDLAMRGCDSRTLRVPFTRGRERSRPLHSIVDEIKMLSGRGFREVTLLGQNVNSYMDNEKDFADLLSACAEADRNVRIRFTTSHPRDLSMLYILFRP